MDASLGRTLARTAFALVVTGLALVSAPDGAIPADRTDRAPGSIRPSTASTDSVGFGDGAGAARHVVRTVDPAHLSSPRSEPSRAGPIYL